MADGLSTARPGPTTARRAIGDDGEAVTADDAAQWEGLSARALAGRLGLPLTALYDVAGSTMDIGHGLAAGGAESGTVVLADRQTAGRGRGGRSWVSDPGSGVWMTLIERGVDPATIELLSVRHGIWVARALDSFADDAIRLKWPNDLYCGARKLAGILIEARWQDQRVLWVAVGIGINVSTPRGAPMATGLRPGTSRLAVLDAVVPAMRAAATVVGALTAAEMREYAARDMARGRTCREPGVGRVTGIGERGELLLATPDGVRAFRSGSLVLDGPEAA